MVGVDNYILTCSGNKKLPTNFPNDLRSKEQTLLPQWLTWAADVNHQGERRSHVRPVYLYAQQKRPYPGRFHVPPLGPEAAHFNLERCTGSGVLGADNLGTPCPNLCLLRPKVKLGHALQILQLHMQTTSFNSKKVPSSSLDKISLSLRGPRVSPVSWNPTLEL